MTFLPVPPLIGAVRFVFVGSAIGILDPIAENRE